MKKTVLVTGASSDIGRFIALEFAKNNYNAIIHYNTNKKDALKLKEEITKDYNVDTLLIKADITKEDEVLEMINESIKHFKKIDVLINNAAYYNDNNYLDKTKNEFLKVLEVNVVGTFLVTKYATKYMDNGTIINISSRDALDTYNDLSMDYCASKAGINSLTKTFSMACSNNKFISIMLPWVNTKPIKEMYPKYLKEELKRTNQARILEPIEVAENIFKLVNNKDVNSGDIKILDIDGGNLCTKNLEYLIK